MMPTTGAVAIAAALLGLWALPGCSAKSSADERPRLEDEGLAKATAGLPDEAAVEPASGAPELEPPLPTVAQPHHAAFDLLVNRPLAHRLEVDGARATFALSAATADFVRYVHGNHGADWMLDVSVDGTPAAAIKGRRASLWVPAYRGDAGQKLAMRVYNPARWDNELRVALNGTGLEPVELSGGWQTVVLDVAPANALRADNEVALEFSNLGRVDGTLSGGAIAWMKLGAVDAPAVAANDTGARGAETAGQPGEAAGSGGGKADDGASEPDAAAEATVAALPEGQGPVTLEPGQGAAWFVWVPQEARLDLKIGTDEGCGVAATAYATGEGGVTAPYVSQTRNLVRGRGQVQESMVDLGEVAGRVVRLELAPSPACPDTAVTLERARLVVPGQAPSVPTAEPPKRVLIWVADTLRADYLPIHFDTDVEAPNFKRLAAEGASFEVAYVQGNESRTSHAALFTGMFPSKNGLVGKGILRPHQELFPEAVQKLGYHTGIHVSNGYVSTTGGFNQGWDHYVNNLRDGWAIDGDSMADHGIAWAKKNADKPFLLYIGTIDPHVTYRAHEGIIEKYDGTDYNGRFSRYISGEDLGKVKGGGIRVTERDKRRIINLYKNEIEFNDRAFGKLRAALEAEGLWEGTMVIVTSDHGEEFWEHGSVGHGHNIHQELVHVPLLVYYPPMVPAGTSVAAGVDIVDVYPTIVDALGGQAPPEVQGKSVLPLIHGVHGGYPEPAIATQYRIHYAMQMQQWKLYLKRGDYELYDREADPLELEDVKDDHPLEARWLLDAMGWFRAHRTAWDKRTWGVPSKVAPGFLEKVAAN